MFCLGNVFKCLKYYFDTHGCSFMYVEVTRLYITVNIGTHFYHNINNLRGPKLKYFSLLQFTKKYFFSVFS